MWQHRPQTAKVHGFKNIGKEEFRQMVLGYCYGYSRAVKHGVYSDGKVRWTRLLLNIAVVAAFAWLGLIAYATMQVLMVLVAIPMYYAPEPELSAFDKMAIDVQIAISIP